jgi:hypothetical protein
MNSYVCVPVVVLDNEYVDVHAVVIDIAMGSLRVALDAGRLGAVHCIFRVVPRNAAAGERFFFAGR